MFHVLKNGLHERKTSLEPSDVVDLRWLPVAILLTTAFQTSGYADTSSAGRPHLRTYTLL
jgi:hypothetical protein